MPLLRRCDSYGIAPCSVQFLQVGDKIVSIDGTAVRTEADVALLAAGEHGTEILLHCSRTSGRDDASRSRVVSIISLVSFRALLRNRFSSHCRRSIGRTDASRNVSTVSLMCLCA